MVIRDNFFYNRQIFFKKIALISLEVEITVVRHSFSGLYVVKQSELNYWLIALLSGY